MDPPTLQESQRKQNKHYVKGETAIKNILEENTVIDWKRILTKRPLRKILKMAKLVIQDVSQKKFTDYFHLCFHYDFTMISR